jgi:hypothetical protein
MLLWVIGLLGNDRDKGQTDAKQQTFDFCQQRKEY